MQEVTLPAQVGRPTGSRASRRLRAQGLVPAVFYGHGREPVALAVDRRALHAALSTQAGLNAFLTLEVEGEKQTAMARQLQRHPTRSEITHLDLVAVSADQVVAAEVPLHLVGDAEEVRHADGLVEQLMHTLSVKAKASAIPSGIEVDVSGLTVGSAIRVGDLPLPADVEVDADPEEPVVIATIPAAPVEEEVAEGEEAPEGAEAPAAEAEPSGGAEG